MFADDVSYFLHYRETFGIEHVNMALNAFVFFLWKAMQQSLGTIIKFARTVPLITDEHNLL